MYLYNLLGSQAKNVMVKGRFSEGYSVSGVSFNEAYAIAEIQIRMRSCTRKRMNEKRRQLKNFNWRLFAALCALALVPAVYQTI